MRKYIPVLMVLIFLAGAMAVQAENVTDKKTYPVSWNQSAEQVKKYPVVWPGSETQMPAEKLAEQGGEQNKSSIQSSAQPVVFLNFTVSSTEFNNNTTVNNFATEEPGLKQAMMVPQEPMPVPRQLWGVIEHGPGGMVIIRG